MAAEPITLLHDFGRVVEILEQVFPDDSNLLLEFKVRDQLMSLIREIHVRSDFTGSLGTIRWIEGDTPE